VLRHQLWRERPGTVVGDVERHRVIAGEDRLWCAAIVLIRLFGRFRLPGAVAEMVRELGPEDPLGERLLRLAEQRVQVFGRPRVTDERIPCLLGELRLRSSFAWGHLDFRGLSMASHTTRARPTPISSRSSIPLPLRGGGEFQMSERRKF